MAQALHLRLPSSKRWGSISSAGEDHMLPGATTFGRTGVAGRGYAPPSVLRMSIRTVILSTRRCSQAVSADTFSILPVPAIVLPDEKVSPLGGPFDIIDFSNAIGIEMVFTTSAVGV